MYSQEILLFLLILFAIALFIKNKWRYDIVSSLTLVTGVIIGVIPTELAFSGFSNAAVITVACVMVISYSISNSGVLLPLENLLSKCTGNKNIYIGLLVIITACLSAFMNNVGALALMMPIAIKLSQSSNISPSSVLMPMSFGSVLGGLCTSIGTPPNLLISSFRMTNSGIPFHLLDFTPLGVIIASISIVFIIIIGWRILPSRDGSTESMHALLDYLTEIKILADSPLIDSQYIHIEKEFDGKVLCIGYIRKNRKKLHITKHDKIQEGDILIVETSTLQLKNIMQNKYLEVIGNFEPAELLKSTPVAILEAVVPQGSRMEKRSANSMRLRNRFMVNIVGISREGKYIKERIQENKLQGGDVVLLLGDSENLIDTAKHLGLLPLTQHFTPKGRQRYLPILLFISSIVLVATHLLAIQIAFAAVIIILLISNNLTLRATYDAIEWPIIILLGCMLPLGAAIQSTGASAMLANLLINLTSALPPTYLLGAIMLITMTLSDVMNNSATAVIMAPISITIADSLHLNPDPFLMAVAIGASCSFLTPISHQNNTLVLGPGGYHFTDYIKLGLPLEIIILAIAIPILPIIWPLEIIVAAV